MKEAAREIAAALYWSVRLPRWQRLRRAADGMLSPRVYATIYSRLRDLPQDGAVLEIGAAKGAATIALARAMIDSGKHGDVVAVEKCEGGSWRDSPLGANRAWLEGNLRAARVGDRVRLVIGWVTPETVARIRHIAPSLCCLMHDADGRVDRDFDAFYDLLLPGGLIIIDDYQPETAAGSPRAVAKKARTAALAAGLFDRGLIEPIEVVRNTLFARKPSLRTG